jgi:hypothetical protein
LLNQRKVPGLAPKWHFQVRRGSGSRGAQI